MPIISFNALRIQNKKANRLLPSFRIDPSNYAFYSNYLAGLSMTDILNNDIAI